MHALLPLHEITFSLRFLLYHHTWANNSTEMSVTRKSVCCDKMSLPMTQFARAAFNVPYTKPRQSYPIEINFFLTFLS